MAAQTRTTKRPDQAEGRRLAIMAVAPPFLTALYTSIRSARRLGSGDARTDQAVNESRQAYRELIALTNDVTVRVGRGRAWVSEMPIPEEGSMAGVIRGLGRELGRHGIGGLTISRQAGGEAFPPLVGALAQAPATGIQDPVEKVKETVDRACPGGVSLIRSFEGAVGQRPLNRETAVTAYMNALDQVLKVVEALKEKKPLVLTDLIATARLIAETVLAGDRYLLALTQIKRHPSYLPSHFVNTAILGSYLGAAFGLSGPRLADLSVASLLADIGLFFNAKFITDKLESTGEFNKVEWNIVKRHPLEGAKLILGGELNDLTIRTLLVTFQHHHVPEMPPILPIDQTDVLSRVAAVADCYDDLVTPRPKRPALTTDQAHLRLRKKADDGRLDPALVSVFTAALGVYPVGTFVRLTDGAIGMVERSPVDGKQLDRPGVRIVFTPTGEKVKTSVELAREDQAGLAVARSLTLQDLGLDVPSFVGLIDLPPVD